MKPTRIIISRTDSIGDVVLTLPMCGVLKEKFPGVKIFFLAKAYTEAIVKSCIHVDEFMNWDEISNGSPASQIEKLRDTGAEVIVHVFPRKEILWLAKRAHIAWRIATAGRIYTISKCNKLVFFSRKNSPLHEAQLNLKLLKPLGIHDEYTCDQLIAYYGFEAKNKLAENAVHSYLQHLDAGRKRIILHPLSKGSASEWPLENYQQLASALVQKNCDVLITGTAEEGARLKGFIDTSVEHVYDTTGKFSLEELVALIGACDGLVAASTGPLHIAAASGICAVGLYSPKRPIHPGRWSPLGRRAYFVTAKSHPRKGEKLNITTDEVLNVLLPALN